jgi:hypothetical protein
MFEYCDTVVSKRTHYVWSLSYTTKI